MKQRAIFICSLILVCLVLSAISTYCLDFRSSPFVRIATSFLQGRLDDPSVCLAGHDYASYGTRAYWPSGLFPPLFYIPLTYLNDSQIEGHLTMIFTILILWVLYSLARKIGFSIRDGLWVAFAFTFASPLLGVIWAPRSHYIAHLIVVICLFAALYEYFTRKRCTIIGLLYAVILATRLTAAFTILFYILDLVIEHRHRLAGMITKMSSLLWPVCISGIALLWYNYARFHSVLEFGFALQNLDPDLAAMRSLGIFSIKHLPGNLYYFFISGPLPITRGISQALVFPYITYSFWGVGLLFTGPYFFSLFWKRLNDRTNILLWTGVVVSALPLLTYYGIGAHQLGPRYMLDFLPLVYVIFLRTMFKSYGTVPFRFKALFVVTFILSFYLFLTKYLVTIWDRLL